MDELINTANEKQNRQKPPLSVGRIMPLEDEGIILIRSIIFLSLVVVIIGISVFSCKKREPAKEASMLEESVSLEGNLENTKIAFMSTRDGNAEVYVMNTDGSEQRNLTNNPASDLYPSWSPFLSSGK